MNRLFTCCRWPAAFAVAAGALVSAGVPVARGLVDTHAGSDAEQAFLARREARVASLPAAPSVPVVPGVAHPIDAFLRAAWPPEVGGSTAAPAPACDDSTFVRRVYLDLVGVIPTTEQWRAFVDSAEPDKRVRLVDELLARSADYADHWTPFWEDALVSSPAGVTGGMASHGDYAAWINDAFRANRPFDLLAAELLDPGLPRHKKAVMGSDNGAPRRVHIVLNESHDDTLRTATTIAQVFMGTAMKCASCHNHFENREWTQKRVAAFAGLFAPSDLEIIRCEQRTGEHVPAAFPFPAPDAPPIGPGLDARLHHAALLLTDPHNPRFARSIVNRLWKRYLGLGLFEPVDDYRLDSPPTHPALLDFLAQDLTRHAYDLKRTIRLILTSEAYAAAFDPLRADHFDVDDPNAPRAWRSPQLRRLTAEQFLDSVRVAIHQRLDPAQRLFRQHASSPLIRAMGRPAVRNDVSTGRADDTAVITGLEMLNGPEFASLVATGPLRAQIEDLAGKDPAAAADLAFAAILSRRPSDEERRVLARALGAPEADACADALWALFASPEFAYVR